MKAFNTLRFVGEVCESLAKSSCRNVKKKNESKNEHASWVKTAEYVREARGGTTHTHHSQSETRRTRQSDPYSASLKHRAGPSPSKKPTTTALYRAHPARGRRVSSFREK